MIETDLELIDIGVPDSSFYEHERFFRSIADGSFAQLRTKPKIKKIIILRFHQMKDDAQCEKTENTPTNPDSTLSAKDEIKSDL